MSEGGWSRLTVRRAHSGGGERRRSAREKDNPIRCPLVSLYFSLHPSFIRLSHASFPLPTPVRLSSSPSLSFFLPLSLSTCFYLWPLSLRSSYPAVPSIPHLPTRLTAATPPNHPRRCVSFSVWQRFVLAPCHPSHGSPASSLASSSPPPPTTSSSCAATSQRLLILPAPH